MRAGGAIALLHIFPSFARGGQQRRLASLAPALGGGFVHRIVSLDGDVTAQGDFADGAVDIETLIARKGRGVSLANLRAFAALLKRVRPDILCTYNFGALEAAIANRLGPGLPHVHFEDGFGPDESPSRQRRRRVILRRLLLRNSFVVVPSRTLETVATGTWRLRRVRRISNGVDIAKFAQADRPARDGALVIGSVGALRREKNYGRLISAFADISGQTTARLVIHGDGPERAALQSIARDRRIAVDFPGATATPESAYASFDIFALSSDTEQMPLSLIEAMAAGLPVVATDVGDVKETLAPENARLVAPLGDDGAYSAMLARLAGDSDLRRRLGAANAEKARASLGLEAMAAAHRALYSDALSGGKR